MNDKYFSASDFKNWFSKEKDISHFFNIGLDPEQPEDKYIGLAAKTKVGRNKLMEKSTSDVDLDIVVEEFLESGGIIVAIEGKQVQIAVESGELTVPRFCIKMQKPTS